MALSDKTMGRYHLLEPVGQSDMGTVYRAHETDQNRPVAVKVLLPHLTGSPAFRDAFIREMQAVVVLDHPHLLTVDDYGRWGDLCFIVTPYVTGGQTLAGVPPGTIPLVKLTGWFIQVATALDYIHRQGLIHQGIKPGNILLEKEHPLLADVGLARLRQAAIRQSDAGGGLGSPAYLSPEQVQATAIDHRADIYALGLVLFEQLTGQIPHWPDDLSQFMARRAAEPSPSPRSLNPAISEPLAGAILKALAPNPGDRYDRAAALAEALSTALRAV